MSEDKACPPKRPRGRPSVRTEHETHTLLRQAASEVFLSEGYAGTSIEAVARKAGMSTRTIYKTVPNKASLFRLVADDAIKTSIAHLDMPPDVATLEGKVFALSRAFADLVLSKEAVLKARAVFAEQAQFPEFRDNFLASIRKVAEAFDQRFVTLCTEATALPDAELHQRAVLLRNMIVGAQREAVLDPDYEGATTKIQSWSDACTQFVMRSMLSGSQSL